MKLVQKLKGTHNASVLSLLERRKKLDVERRRGFRIMCGDATTMQKKFHVTCKAEVLCLVAFHHFAWVGTSCGIDVYSIKERDMLHETHFGSDKDVVKQLIAVDRRIWGACNNDIHVWSVDEMTGHPLKSEATLEPHLGRAECLCRVGIFVLITFKNDPVIVLWNSKTFEYVATLVGNEKEPSRGIAMVDDFTMCTTCLDKSAPVVVWRTRVSSDD